MADPIQADDRPPKFSVIVPVYQPEPRHLRACIESVRSQTYGGWELLLVADGPQPEAVMAVLTEAEATDERIEVLRLLTNGGISAASQLALGQTRHEFIALLDHDDLYSPDALGAFAAELGRYDDVDMAYSDEDKLDALTEERKLPFFKPAFSMERLRTQMYLGHLLVVRRSLALEVGGFRSPYDGAQDHDLALRIAERARRVLHLPRLLYHWREVPGSTAGDDEAKTWAWDAGRLAVQDHLGRTGFPATAEGWRHVPGVIELEPRLLDHPLVSIIIPTGGARRPIHGLDTLLITQAIASLLARTTYPNYEIVVVFDAKSDHALVAEVADGVREAKTAGSTGSVSVRFVQEQREFNFANACNVGAMRSSGDVLLFLNDDTEITQANWLERMVMYATRPDLGAVGVKLLYGDGRIQHAGVWCRLAPAHRYAGFRGDHPGNFAALRTPQNCYAVTGACLAIERTKFEEIGGFSAQFPLAYNDVDLCFKLLNRGYRNVVDCATEVVHHESSSRDPTVQKWETELLERRWKPLLNRDIWDNPCNVAVGVNEYPVASIGLVERLIADPDGIDCTARSWPDDGAYGLGRRSGNGIEIG